MEKEIGWKQVQEWFDPPLTFTEIKALTPQERDEIKQLVIEAIRNEQVKA